MRAITLISLLFLILACSNDNKTSTNPTRNVAIVNSQVDSVKWLFYAYTCNGKARFVKDSLIYNFNPTECDVNLKVGSNRNDTLIYELSYSKANLEYKHIYDGLMVYGFMHVKGVFVPLTGMVHLDNFESLDFVRNDNDETDSVFTVLLKKADTSKLSAWLLTEARKRNVL
jgi:hypothetical protein